MKRESKRAMSRKRVVKIKREQGKIIIIKKWEKVDERLSRVDAQLTDYI